MPTSVDFIGIGAARCATSWLANILRAHPDVCLSDPKEIRYFNEHVIPVGAKKGKSNPNFSRGLDWYEAHFAHARARQIRGEFTPIYLCDETAPRVIHQTVPEVRLIVSLRNPIDRAYSHFWQHRWWGVHEIGSFEEAVDQKLGYLEMSLYGSQLTRYLKYFSKQQIIVTIFEELIHSPTTELERLYDFLGVGPNNVDLASMDRNPSLSVRSNLLKHVARTTSQALSGIGLGGIQRGLRRMGVDRLWHSFMSDPRENPPLARRTRRRLQHYFEDDVAGLEETLGRDLSIWQIEKS
jgi:hypothetical protein